MSSSPSGSGPKIRGNGVKVMCKDIGHETEKGIWVTVATLEKGVAGRREVCLPLSQVNLIVRHPVSPYVYVSLWIATKEGFPV